MNNNELRVCDDSGNEYILIKVPHQGAASIMAGGTILDELSESFFVKNDNRRARKISESDYRISDPTRQNPDKEIQVHVCNN